MRAIYKIEPILEHVGIFTQGEEYYFVLNDGMYVCKTDEKKVWYFAIDSIKNYFQIIEEPKQIIDFNGIQTEPFTHEEKKVIAVEKDIFKLEIWNLLLEKFKLANDLQRIAILEVFEETGYPQSDMVKLYQKLANDTN